VKLNPISCIRDLVACDLKATNQINSLRLGESGDSQVPFS